MKDLFKDKKLLITGGTGSFGNAVLKKFISSDFSELRIFSRDEKKQNDMRLEHLDDRVKFFLGDVRDYESIHSAMEGVDFVFHAAALKQVPSCEFFPLEAVKTNIIGANNALTAAIKNDVKRVIVLSTDKAVYPINVMGMTKAMMEKIMISNARKLEGTNTKICATRYGNVMASRGSVIPLFTEQIKAGKPITITNPDMTRFLMSLEDSVNLVLHAFSNMENGDIFVQKSPASTIQDLALALMKIFKKESEIKIIGTRHGEKIYETLLGTEERSKAEEQDNFFRAPMDARNLNYDEFFEKGDLGLKDYEEYNSHNTVRLNVDEIVDLLLKLPYIQENLND
tara:strand:- start:10779 stop:11798 length:1020 start_codon:yes stop_codon:yes gene_type:complete